MFILLTGPEKTGKTTLANQLVNLSRKLGVHGVHARLRKPPGVDGSDYLKLIKLAADPRFLVVMDRGWPDEVVYSTILGRESKMSAEGWNEWCLGDPARQLGLTVLVAPRYRLAELDETDLQIPWTREAGEFSRYAKEWGYLVVDPVVVSPEEILNVAVWSASKPTAEMLPTYCGPENPNVLLVGERRNEASRYPMAWAPMTTPAFSLVAKHVQCFEGIGRTNAADLADVVRTIDVLKVAKVVVAFGETAARTIRKFGRHPDLEFTHPAAVVRWGTYKSELNRYGETLREQISKKIYEKTGEKK